MKKIIRSRLIYIENSLLDGYLVVQNGKIEKIAQGEPEPEERQSSEYFTYLDRMILPGLTDTHCFFMGKYFQEYGKDYRSYGVEDLFLEFMNLADSPLLLGRNISDETFQRLQKKGLPNGYPIVLFHESFEEMLVNEKAAKNYQVQSGGVTMECCVHLIKEVMKDKEAFFLAYENHTKKLLKQGITAVKEIIFDTGFGFLEALLEYRKVKGILPVRTTVVSQPVAEPWNISWGIEMKNKYCFEDLRFYGYNRMLDGSMSQEEAHLKHNYYGKNFSVKTQPDYETAYRLVKEADDNGLAVSLHAQGGKAVEEAVSIFSSMKRDKNGKLQNRHSITDLEMGEVEEFKKMAESGIYAEIYPQIQSIYEDWQGKIDQVKGHAGNEFKKIWNRKGLISEGVAVSCATDLPLLFPNLPESLYHGCGGFIGESKEAFVGENTMDRVSMVNAWTSGGIENLYGSSAKLGKIKEGYEADLVIFDKNLLKEPFDLIRDSQVVTTFFKGEPVFIKED